MVFIREIFSFLTNSIHQPSLGWVSTQLQIGADGGRTVITSAQMWQRQSVIFLGLLWCFHHISWVVGGSYNTWSLSHILIDWLGLVYCQVSGTRYIIRYLPFHQGYMLAPRVNRIFSSGPYEFCFGWCWGPVLSLRYLWLAPHFPNSDTWSSRLILYSTI